ncbi:MAG: hypothetical protein HY074_16060 [Deltaproteobacteria bacterium]|nr:hypothetical protein [Deltaproteobacteria bacterium]
MMRILFAMLLALSCCLAPLQLHAESLIPDFLPVSALHFRVQDLPNFNSLSPPTRWSDVRGWRPLGGRWAAALDAHGAVIAIYDLSVTENIVTADWVHLGIVGGPTFNLKTVVAALRPMQSEGRPPKKLAQALKKLTKETPSHLEADLMPADWFEHVPWTESARRNFAAAGLVADQAPSSFRLSDLDYAAVAISPTLFRKAIQYLKRFNIDLTQIQYVRRADGGYDLLVRGAAQSAADLGRPMKIADLNSVSSGFWETIRWNIAGSVIGFAVGLIPVPVVSALIGTALDRFLTFEGDVRDLHREAAREMIATAEQDGGPFSAFASLTPNERKRAGISMFISNASIVSTWNWIFKGGEKSWRDNMRDDEKRAVDARGWLTKHGETLTPLNTRYAFGQTASGQRRLYLLARASLWGRHHPTDAINYGQPNLHVAERIAVESASIIVDFGSHFIPYVGGIVSTAFDQALRGPVQYTKALESRLGGLLEEHMRIAHEDWSYELATIDRQRVNPLESSRAAATNLVAQQRKRLGIDQGPIFNDP